MILKALAIFFIGTYQAFFSHIFGGNCRFYPSCSEYATECFKSLSFPAALYYTFMRLIKCYPGSSVSGFDPVPDRKNVGRMSSGCCDYHRQEKLYE